MALGERIKTCRQNAGMSQEKVAELVGVSRQAVTKWEVNQSAPNTENLFKLAEIFGTTVDMLLASEDEVKQSPAEQIYYLYKMEEEKKAALKKQAQKRNILIALLVAVGYISIYLIGRIIWCDLSQSNLIGWLFTVRPSGEHSYLYGWLLSSNLFWYAMVISVIPTLFGKYKFSCTTLVGFVIGLVAGMIFGPYPEGASIGHDHYGWAIWGAIYLVSIVAGIIVERYKKKSDNKPSE
jgi:transcriptional regulator with XRE-family HTH domain